jgi:hypothetical protein
VTELPCAGDAEEADCGGDWATLASNIETYCSPVVDPSLAFGALGLPVNHMDAAPEGPYLSTCWPNW